MAIGLVDGEVHRLAVVGDLQHAILVDGRVVLGPGLAAEEDLCFSMLQLDDVSGLEVVLHPIDPHD